MTDGMEAEFLISQAQMPIALSTSSCQNVMLSEESSYHCSKTVN